MSASITNCGAVGWISDRQGYRYSSIDPKTNQSWPALPAEFTELAYQAVQASGFGRRFFPDMCLINCYQHGARMGTHRDYDEQDFSQPIVSISIGLSTNFLWYGAHRTGPAQRIPLYDGDILILAGPARTGYHAVTAPVRQSHPLTGERRFNLTLRKAL